MTIPSPLDLPRWLKENSDRLRPPVNNFCLYSGADFVIMVLGGPNTRTDYHINETEEWFYQHKGDMLLRIVDDGIFRDIEIKEGQMFLLPGNTPHNPVRFADTVGIVVERARPEASIDRLRWYCRAPGHEKPTVIREASFHLTDLDTELKPVIEHWITNEESRRCPACGTIAEAK
ncbi:3-hydroxyanthranilic acid dioxygenase [Russula ochroleuca]|jgi:3-hydroxyanthranilate 3,4-dioxygenase|uniref:3-hydroxyanthranilate 3,4-dioxygenase n=1 Tax=Russula ochroleuca TaxID=152965 RepID=A0A9P5N099_9AGAM|nr:3-hydroxyanthranilic acid dioxygenase [Russula ochroleuca]